MYFPIGWLTEQLMDSILGGNQRMSQRFPDIYKSRKRILKSSK